MLCAESRTILHGGPLVEQLRQAKATKSHRILVMITPALVARCLLVGPEHHRARRDLLRADPSRVLSSSSSDDHEGLHRARRQPQSDSRSKPLLHLIYVHLGCVLSTYLPYAARLFD